MTRIRRSESAYRWLLAAILCLAAAVYLPAIGGTAIWDDHILLDPHATEARRLADCFTRPFLEHYFRPLVALSFFIDRSVFGGSTRIAHLENLVLHLLATAAVLAMLWTATRRRSTTLAGGTLFALQPAQVATVAWIGGRTDSLCTLWSALFGWQLLRAARSGGRGNLAAAWVCFVAALLCKEQVGPAVLLVPAAYAWFDTRPGRGRRGWAAFVPFALACGAVLWLGSRVGMPHVEPWPRHLWSVVERLSGATVYYSLLLGAPAPKWMHTLSLGGLAIRTVWPPLCAVAIMGGAAAGILRWRKREPAAAWLLLWGVLALLPVSNLVPLPYVLVAPYRAGIAGIGAAGFLGWAAVRLIAFPAGGSLRAWFASATPGRLFAGVAAANYLLWCAGLCVWGSAQWKGQEQAFRAFTQADPDSILAAYTLVDELNGQGRFEEAVSELQRVLDRVFGPGEWVTTANVKRTLAAGSSVLDRVSDSQGSLKDARWYLARLFVHLGDTQLHTAGAESAMQAYGSADLLVPGDLEANKGRGICAYMVRDYVRAEDFFRFVLGVKPGDADAMLWLANAQRQRHQWNACEETLGRWYRLRPGFVAPWIDLARARAEAGDLPGALASLRRVPPEAGGRDEIARAAAELAAGDDR